MVSSGSSRTSSAPVRVLPGLERSGNSVLDALPASERDPLLARAELQRLEAQTVLYRPQEPLPSVWFPTTGIVSLLTVLGDGSGIETATIGREGMVGVTVFLGDHLVANGRGVVQLRGNALRLDVDTFRAASVEGTKLRELLLAYTRALLLQVAQGVACAAAHTIPQRLARWILQTTDRVANDEIELTQQFLSEILGVRRASVTESLHALEERDAIATTRGRIRIARRDRLAEMSCECYDVVGDEYARLLPDG